MKLLEGPVEEKVLGTVWNHNDDVFWIQSKSSRGYQINEESNIKPSSSDLRSPWNPRHLPDSCQDRDAKTVVDWTTVG